MIGHLEISTANVAAYLWRETFGWDSTLEFQRDEEVLSGICTCNKGEHVSPPEPLYAPLN